MSRFRRVMQLFFSLLSFVAVLAAAPPLFTLALAAPGQPLKAGVPVILHVKVTNTATRELTFPISHGAADVGKIYRVHVLDEQGQTPPRRVLPCQIPPNLCAGDIQGQGVKPGQSLIDEIDISWLYTLNRPGKYKIWVAEPTYPSPPPNEGLVTSNVVTVTVVK